MSDVTQYQIAVGSLAGVVVVLFGYLRSVDAKQETKLKECEEDRKELWKELLEQAKAQRDMALRLNENQNRTNG